MADPTDPAAATLAEIVRNSKSPSYIHKKQREQKEAVERRQVTKESLEKTAELAEEGISVRDFALAPLEEKAEREKTERNRRADEYQARRRETGEDVEDDEKLRELLQGEEEEDEKQAKRRKQDPGSQWYGGGGGGWGEPMDSD